MEDLKDLETSMRSTMDAQMKELREMIVQLLPKGVGSPLPPLEVNSSAAQATEVEESDGTKESPTKSASGKEKYSEVPHIYSPDPPIPHPHINNRGDPPKFNPSCFSNWQFLMRSYMKSASIELWRIIEVGFKAHDPTNMTRREVVDCQLNDLALNMIQTVVGEKHMSHIELATTAKEAWDTLTNEFIGNESMKRNRFESLRNQAEGFFMFEGEEHEDMYRRLKTLATQFRSLGATHVDDAWIKRKYVSALWPFESTDLKSLQGRHNYHLMTSNEVMQEMSAFKVAAKNTEDARARAIGMHKSSPLALKAKVVVQDDDDEEQEDVSHWKPKELEDTLKDYSALTHKVFWKSPSKARDYVNKSSGKKEGGQRVRSCYNCQDHYHFVAECPFENREHHGGKLVRKDKSKTPNKKPFFKKNATNKKPPRMVLISQEEYSSGEEEEETKSEVAAIAIASSSSSSLFKSPNENVSTSSARCLMAKANEVSSPSTPKGMSNVDDPTSLKVKEEIVALDYFISNMQGETKKHVETLTNAR
jgi:hypothetical protein